MTIEDAFIFCDTVATGTFPVTLEEFGGLEFPSHPTTINLSKDGGYRAWEIFESQELREQIVAGNLSVRGHEAYANRHMLYFRLGSISTDVQLYPEGFGGSASSRGWRTPYEFEVVAVTIGASSASDAETFDIRISSPSDIDPDLVLSRPAQRAFTHFLNLETYRINGQVGVISVGIENRSGTIVDPWVELYTLGRNS